MRQLATVIGLSTMVAVPAIAWSAEARVEMELAMPATFPALSQQQWYQLLSELGVDGLRIRKAGAEDKAEVKVAGTNAAPVYRVVGMLTSTGQLNLPGGQFSSRDRGGLSKWLGKLRAEGPASLTGGGEKSPFGLSARQFAAVNADLARPLEFSTKDMTPGELLEKLTPTLNYSLALGRATQARLAGAEPIGEELQGLSSGTAMAYALRSEGLGLVPQFGEGKKLQYALVKPDGKQTTWPVGWPLEDRKPKDIVPALFETLNAEIDDIPLTEAMEAIAGRLKVVVLYDHYALARQGIELAKLQAKFPSSKTWYSKIVDRLLHQSGLKGEWRLDDAGKPLLWVTTLRPVK
ncbi:MAG TPA: hypothetical protein VFI31_17595 [Pirellulales bacterium]|nr:hypothetical protein [Pirellulales bacterium]